MKKRKQIKATMALKVFVQIELALFDIEVKKIMAIEKHIFAPSA